MACNAEQVAATKTHGAAIRIMACNISSVPNKMFKTKAWICGPLGRYRTENTGVKELNTKLHGRTFLFSSLFISFTKKRQHQNITFHEIYFVQILLKKSITLLILL